MSLLNSEMNYKSNLSTIRPNICCRNKRQKAKQPQKYQFALQNPVLQSLVKYHCFVQSVHLDCLISIRQLNICLYFECKYLSCLGTEAALEEKQDSLGLENHSSNI